MTSPVSAIEAIEKAMEGVTPCGYQRRPAYEYRCETVSGTPWSLCATQEATDMFERVPGFEYRAIYDANTVLALARQAEALQQEVDSLKQTRQHNREASAALHDAFMEERKRVEALERENAELKLKVQSMGASHG